MLHPGGYFLYADFRFAGDVPAWERDLAAAPLQLVQTRVINAEVLRGMDQNSARSERLIVRRLPKWLQSLGRDFAGIRGSRVYDGIRQGTFSYRSYCFVKPASGQSAQPPTQR